MQMASFSVLPIHDRLSREFYAATGEGRLLAQRCENCDRLQFYPRARCTGCHSDAVVWEQLSGNGIVHSFSVLHMTPNAAFAEECPYVFAIIEMDEGVRMSGRVVGVDPDAVRCDMPVRVVFEQRGDVALPWFTAR